MSQPYPNKQETDLALKLMQVLQHIVQREFGWLLTGMTHRVTHPNPQVRTEIQDRVDAAVQGVLLVYLFAIFDEYTTDSMRGNWLAASEKTELRAFRHIRNSVAHGQGGTRAKDCKWRQEFEDVMNSAHPFPNLVWDRSNDTIDLTRSQVAHDCHVLMSTLAQTLAGRLANNRHP